MWDKGFWNIIANQNFEPWTYWSLSVIIHCLNINYSHIHKPCLSVRQSCVYNLLKIAKCDMYKLARKDNPVVQHFRTGGALVSCLWKNNLYLFININSRFSESLCFQTPQLSPAHLFISDRTKWNMHQHLNFVLDLEHTKVLSGLCRKPSKYPTNQYKPQKAYTHSKSQRG